jgi:hypothetical protein
VPLALLGVVALVADVARVAVAIFIKTRKKLRKKKLYLVAMHLGVVGRRGRR